MLRGFAASQLAVRRLRAGIAIAIRRLRGQRRRRRQMRRREVEELQHVVGIGIASRKRLQVEARLNELEDGRMIAHDMRHKMRLDPRRDDNYRHAQTAMGEVARRLAAAQHGRDVVGFRQAGRRDMVVESSRLIPGQKKS